MKTPLIALTLATVFVCTQANAGQWRYDTERDKMTGKSAHWAVITSNKSLKLAAPYSGDNYGSLMVRKHPQYGLDVVVYISKGQILCTSYDGCSVKIKFGDSQPVTFWAVGSADHDSTKIFLRNAQKFVELAKNTKSIKVQMTIYQAGAPVLEFDSPAPLVWDTPAAKPQINAAEEAKKAEAKKQEAEQDEKRQEDIRRIAALAGYTGGASASYAGKVRAKVKPNIVFTEDSVANPTAEVEVRTALDGSIISQRLIKSSGNKAWDEAVIKAIIRTETMPRDVGGRVPTPMILEFRPRD